MTINYGKRDPGALTAASPGDRLYIPLQFFNDSGASISIGSSLAVSDVEIYKNGNVVQRATDSGVSILGDTGNFDSKIGFKGISVQLFNTADDTGFYDAGSHYWVGIDSVTVDGRTVRFWPAVFEIGTPRANLVEIAGDTGHAVQLGKFASVLSGAGQIDTGTGAADTGILSNSVWNSLKASHGDTGTFGEELASGVNVVKITGDTGAASRLGKFAGIKITDSGTVDTGTGQLQGAAASLDTGAVNQAVWQADASRVLTAFPHDTGVADTVWKSSRSTYTDTGSFGFGVNVHKLRNDTGSAQHLAQLANEYDTGRLQAEATATLDTGAVHAAVWQVPSGNANRTLTNIDTGAALHLANLGNEYDTGRLQAEATATLDTGAISNAVWNSLKSSHGDTGTFGEELGQGVNMEKISGDTGAADRLLKFAGTKLSDSGTLDTGSGATGGGSASVDTGQINQAVWQGDASRTLTAWAFDTGVQQKLDRQDTGVRSAITQLSTKTDTGVPASVWTSAARTLTAWAFDTGVQQKLDRLDTGLTETIDRILADTDTGLKTIPAAIKAKTDSLTFTVAGFVDANIQAVNDVTISGNGDTGAGTTWGPA